MTSLNRTLSQITRSAEMANARSVGLASLSRSLNQAARASQIHSLNQMNSLSRSLNQAARASQIHSLNQMNSLSRSLNQAARASQIHSLNQMNSLSRSLNQAARASQIHSLNQMSSVSRTLDGIARASQIHSLNQMSSVSRTLDGFARLPEVTSFVSRKTFEILALFKEEAQFNEAEWFPHSTFPKHLLNRSGHDDYSDEIILAYYRENWATVCQVIEEELSECSVDRDVKEALRQALVAHGSGLYQLVPPSLFTAIERAVRVSLYNDDVGNIPLKNRLVDLVGNLPISDLSDGVLAFVGFSQLSHHLYENIHTDDARERFWDAPIPNRHATIHGLVIYSSEKSSLNAIFVAMYVFQVLTALKLRHLRIT